jgi:hypothetical protein
MVSRLIVHIGLQKSGTTYLQEVLAASASELAEAGFTYPLSPPGKRRRRIENHEWPTYDLLGPEYPWVSAQRAAAEKGTWKELERQVRRADGTVLLSAEALSTLRTPAIRTLLGRLGVGGIEIIVTARSLNRILPSLWQQHVRNGRVQAFGRYLDMLEEQRNLPEARIEEECDLHLWRAFAIGRLVRRWAREVGTEHVTVVTSPGSPPELLWDRFSEAVGLPPLKQTDALRRPVHTSLTAPEAMALAAVNSALRRDEWPADDARRLRDLVLTKGFQPRGERGPRIAVPPDRRARVAAWIAEDAAELLTSSVNIIGDIADLRPDLDRSQVRPPTAEEVGAAGAAAVLAVARANQQDRR